MPHQINWEEGHYGKGLIDEHGNLHTWINGEDYDYHREYENEHGLNAQSYLYIKPNGTVYDGGIGWGPKNPDADFLQDVDPRLRLEGSQGWEF